MLPAFKQNACCIQSYLLVKMSDEIFSRYYLSFFKPYTKAQQWDNNGACLKQNNHSTFYKLGSRYFTANVGHLLGLISIALSVFACITLLITIPMLLQRFHDLSFEAEHLSYNYKVEKKPFCYTVVLHLNLLN